MNPSALFRDALELYYQMSQAGPRQQGGLRDMYESHLDNAALVIRESKETLHSAILKRSPVYARFRASGRTPEEAFEQSGSRLL